MKQTDMERIAPRGRQITRHRASRESPRSDSLPSLGD